MLVAFVTVVSGDDENIGEFLRLKGCERMYSVIMRDCVRSCSRTIGGARSAEHCVEEYDMCLVTCGDELGHARVAQSRTSR